MSLNQFNGSDLLNKSVCCVPTENCYYRMCDKCSSVNVSNLLWNKDDSINEKTEVTWSLWVMINNRVELQHFNASLLSLIEQLNSHWTAFITHTYVTRQQRDYIKTTRINSNLTTFATIYMDFAENFSFIVQNEIQSAYWNQKQATIYTVVINVGNSHRNIIIISNCMVHDTKFVYCIQQLLMKFVRKEYPTIHKMNYIRRDITVICHHCLHLILFSIQWRLSISIQE